MCRLKNIILIIALLIVSFSCHKRMYPDSSLPPITMDGKNTFGCYVDNELWLPSTVYKLGMRSLCVEYNTNGDLSINVSHDMAGSSQAGGGQFGFTYKNIFNTGSYDFTDINKARVIVTIENIDSPAAHFTVLGGALIITKFDKTNNIIAGTFNFKIRNNDTGNIHEATEGRFDLNFGYCQ